MKIPIWLVIVLSICNVHAQKSTIGSLKRNIVKINTLSTVFGQPMIVYERVWNQKWSSQISVGYFKQVYSNSYIKSTAISSEFTLDTKLYTGQFKNGPEGLYFSGFITLIILDEEEEFTNYSLKGTAGYLGPSLGYQWRFGNVMLDTYSGFGIEFISPEGSLFKSSSLNNNYMLSGFFMKYGLALGYNF